MTARDTLEVAVYGPTIVRSDGLPVGLSPRERAVLTALSIEAHRPASVDAMVDVIWGHDAPSTCRQIVQNNVSTLRRRFGRATIVTESGPTYRLGVLWTIDLDRFTRHVATARSAAFADDHRAEVSHLRRALDLVRGEPFQDLPSSPVVDASRARHHQLLLTAQEDAVLADLAVGNVAASISAASALALAEPYRELRWSLLALGLYRSGDRRGSLEALQRARRMLRNEAGIDPGPVMIRLERMILDDDRRVIGARPRAVLGLAEAEQVTTDRSMSRLVGAERDIDRVRSLCARSVESESAVWITMTGDDASQTAAFAHQIALDAALDGWTVLESACHPNAQRVLEPLGALARQVVEQMPDPTAAFDASVFAGLAALWGDGIDGFDNHDGAEPSDAALDVLEHCAARSPTLVVIDEAQHLTASVLAALARLTNASVPLVLLAVGAATDVAIPDGAEVIRLTPDDLPDMEVDVSDAPSLDFGTVGQSGLTDVARLIAIAGAPLSFDVIHGTGRSPHDLREVLVAGVDLGVLRPSRDGGFDIGRSSVRSSLIEPMDTDARSDVHRALAMSFLAHGEVFAAAPHLLASSSDPELVIESVAAAADHAARASMFVEAAALLGQAVDRSIEHHGVDAEPTLRLVLMRTEYLRRVGDPTYVDLVWEVIRRSERNGLYTLYALAAAALCKLGPLTDAGQLDEDVAAVVADALARCDDAEARARCAGAATLFFSMGGRAELCREYFSEALTLAREVGGDRLLIDALGSGYLVLTHPRDSSRRQELSMEMLALAERMDDDDARCEALHFVFSVQLQHCDPMIRTTLARQEALAPRLGPGRRWMAEYQRSCVLYLDGRLDEALEIAMRWLDAAPVAASRAQTAYTMVLLGVRLAQGDSEALREQIDAAISEHPAMPAWRAIAAFLAAERGDLRRVVAESEALGNGAMLPVDLAWGGAVLLLGRAVARVGDRERVLALHDLMSPYAGTFTWVGSTTVGPFDLALAELSLALDDLDAAERHIASLERGICLLGADVFRPDLDHLRGEIDERRRASPPTIHSA